MTVKMQMNAIGIEFLHPDHSTTAGVLCSCCMSASSCQLLCVNTHPKILNKVISKLFTKYR